MNIFPAPTVMVLVTEMNDVRNVTDEVVNLVEVVMAREQLTMESPGILAVQCATENVRDPAPIAVEVA